MFAGLRAMIASSQVAELTGLQARRALPLALRNWPRDLFVLGGTSAQGPCLRSAERFSSLAGVWDPLPEMPTARGCPAGAALGRRIYACGGFADGGGGVDGEHQSVLNSVEFFEVDEGTWKSAPKMIVPRWGAAAAVVGRKLYVCGGYDGSGSALRSVECLEPARQVWFEAPPMAERRARAAAAACGGHLYVCGGFNGTRGAPLLRSVERLDPDGGGWRPAPTLQAARYIATAATLSGKIYICGGVNVDGSAVSSAERFDPAKAAWEALPLMGTARYGASSAATEGKLYVFGGNGPKFRLSSVELFDPEVGMWEPVLPMLARRSGAVAVSRIHALSG